MEDLKNSVSKAVGTKAVMRALKAGSAQRVYVARDIDTFLYQKVTRACEDAGVPIRRVDETKRSEERRGGKECRSRWSPYH